MERDSEIQEDRWVNERVSALTVADDWQPNVNRGFAMLRARRLRAAHRRNWSLAAIAIICLCIIALPASRAAARRVWSELFFEKPRIVRIAGTTNRSSDLPLPTTDDGVGAIRAGTKMQGATGVEGTPNVNSPVRAGLDSHRASARNDEVPTRQKSSTQTNADRTEVESRTKNNSKDGLTYVWIPPGRFEMGCSPDDPSCRNNAVMQVEEPVHSVTITEGFWIGQTEVTQAAYRAVMHTNPSNFKGDRLPVEQVSWDESLAYCQAAEMRLPTEAEWEYAARGGSTEARYAPLDSIAWFDDNSGETTHQVAQKQANKYGLYDSLGNVWEWVADWYGPYDESPATDPRGPAEGRYRILRGGSWHLGAQFARVSKRLWYGPSTRFNYIGFRCAGN